MLFFPAARQIQCVYITCTRYRRACGLVGRNEAIVVISYLYYYFFLLPSQTPTTPKKSNEHTANENNIPFLIYCNIVAVDIMWQRVRLGCNQLFYPSLPSSPTSSTFPQPDMHLQIIN